MEKVRMFKWNDTIVPFHKGCWEKRRTLEAKRHCAKTFVESLILITATFIAVYVVI